MADVLSMVTSPAWAYVALLALLVADAFVPVVPTQAIMITSGALTVYGGLSLPTVVAVGAAGVLLGDWACYLLGRSTHDRKGPLSLLRRRWADRAGDDPTARVRRGRAPRAAARFTKGLREPGPLVIFLCRFVPGGRMAACFSAGRVQYPYQLFTLYETIAAVCWASYGAVVGHVGGTALTQSAWRLFAVAAIAATIFSAAGWALALVGPGGIRRRPAAEGATPARAASTDVPPQ
jgi:membrane protein DedA with SNARE-associated domain